MPGPAGIKPGGRLSESAEADNPNEDLMHEHGTVGRVMLIHTRVAQLLRYAPQIFDGRMRVER